ncbi:MAG: BMP family ABC transporter substrate-binding protein [Clostridiales bacterium]|jgi:basic membrane protein A|nr:BMP family ABC transporter substrate-binding protein [Clostridiales bacterium]
MKRILVVLLCAVMVFSLAACKKGEKSKNGGDITSENIKIGFVHIGDSSDKGYTYNHDLGTKNMQKALGLKDEQIINKYNIPESSACDTAIRELVDAGCNIIFATSFGFEDYMIAIAKEYSNIQFCHATGYKAKDTALPNYHNYFGNIFEARYLSGIAAGLKTETNVLGYVAAMPYAEVISGYDAFYLGALSVNPDVTMKVIYTNDWNYPPAEMQAAQALIDAGCDVLGQHCDSTATMTTAEANNAWGVGYNSDMIEAAPNAVLTSAVWDWSKYLIFAVSSLLEGTPIPTDWSGGIKDGVCDVSALNENVIAPGTADAINAARDNIIAGDLQVFKGPLYDNQDNLVVEDGAVFIEPQSAPSFSHVLKGIEIIGG